MQQGGQNNNEDKDDLLRLVAVIAAAQERAHKTSRQGEQMQNDLRDAPGSLFRTLVFVVSVKEEGYDAEAKEPTRVERQPAISEVKQESNDPRRDQEEEESGMTHLERHPLPA